MMFEIRFTVRTLMRSLLRGQEGRVALRCSAMVFVAVILGVVGIGVAQLTGLGATTRSTSIALDPTETRLAVVNREANTLSIIEVKDANGNDVTNKLAEIAVGQEPRCVAVHPTGKAAYVTNGISGTVSVVDLVQGREVQQIRVGTEPRGCALTADGSLLYVANHTEG